jgi:hypothetical protein
MNETSFANMFKKSATMESPRANRKAKPKRCPKPSPMILAAKAMRKDKVIDWDAQPLGKVDDGVLADALGTTRSIVATARWRRKIKPVGRGK